MGSHHLLFCAFGTGDHTNECKFALARFLQLSEPATRERCQSVVYTDRPQDWQGFDFSPLRARVEIVEPERFREWKGPHDFVYRVKLESLRHLARDVEGWILMMDTDTHLRRDLGPLLDSLEQGQAFMHLCEGPITRKNGFGEWERYLAVTGFPTGLLMWNSGVVGLPASAVEDFMDEALAVTDRVYAGLPRHICEQFALSYCLQRRFALQAAQDYVHHYWALKDFRQLLRELMRRPGLEGGLTRLAEVSERVLPEMIEGQRQRLKRQPLRLWRQLTGQRWKIEDYFGLFRDF